MKETQDFDNDLLALIDHFIIVGNSLKGKKFPTDKIRFAEPLAKKAFNHIVSARDLFEGIKITLLDNSHVQLVDFSSIAVLTRAALETYLTFNYVFIKPQSQEEKDFRFISWDLAGFIEREKFPVTSSKHAQIVKDEAELKNKWLKELEKNNVYLSLTEPQKRFIKSGKWRMDKSWLQLAIDAGISETTFRHLYSYLSSYAHSGRLSILQIEQTKEFENEKSFSRIFQTINLMTIARLLTDYVTLIPDCKETFESNPKAKQITYIWEKVGDYLKL